MKQYISIAILSVSLITVTATGLFSGCSKKGEVSIDSRNEVTTTPIEIAVVHREDLSLSKSYTGALEGSEQADIVPKMSERIVTVNATVGTAVSKGQVLVVLDKGGASSQYLQSEANLLNAEKNLARMKALYQEGAISLQALDGTQTTYDIAKANFEAARQNVELVSPISGVVTAMKARVGELSSPGIALVTIARLNEMKVIYNLNEGDVGDVVKGQEVLVFSESRPDMMIKGKVSEFFKSADVQSRTFEVRSIFPNTADHWFKPGMFVKVKYQSKPQSQVLVVPNQAILSDGSSNRVFIVRNGMSFQKSVTVGTSDGIKTMIRDELSELDSVVTVGWNNLRDSSKVTVVTASK